MLTRMVLACFGFVYFACGGAEVVQSSAAREVKKETNLLAGRFFQIDFGNKAVAFVAAEDRKIELLPSDCAEYADLLFRENPNRYCFHVPPGNGGVFSGVVLIFGKEKEDREALAVVHHDGCRYTLKIVPTTLVDGHGSRGAFVLRQDKVVARAGDTCEEVLPRPR